MRLLLIITVLISLVSVAGAKVPAALTRVQVKEAEQRLTDLGYWTGRVDGVFDSASQFALIAFEKREGRAITGKLTLDELNAIRAAAKPAARETGYEHV